MTEQVRQDLHPMLDRIQRPALIVGGGATLLCLIGLFWPQEFFRSYLFAYLFWIGIPLGCFGILMLQHLTGGAWGLAIRRLLEGGTRMLPLMALLFVPLIFGIPYLYIWAQEEHVQADPLLQFKSAYLNVGFFLARAALYFAIWIVGALLLNYWSRQQDGPRDPYIIRRRLQLLSGPGLLLYVLTMTFAAVDWVMSIDPHWFSTIFGFIFISGQALGTLAFMIVMLALLARTPPLSDIVTRDHFQDLGSLLLAFTLLWAYMAFSQYLIVWSGNLPEETPFYIYRAQGPIRFVALSLIIVHFAVPFVLLLLREVKRSVRALAIVASVIVLMRFVDLFWIVKPMFLQARMDGEVHAPGEVPLHWLDLLIPIAMGGIWLAVFVWQLRRRPLIPPHDPRLLEVATHHG